jgi:large subunit ribosomal protein L5
VSDEPTAAPRKPAKPAAKKAAAPRKPAATKAAATSAAKRSASAPEAPPKQRRAAANGGELVGLRLRYRDEVVPALIREFRYANPMQVPRLEKVVVNIGLGEAIQNAKAIDAAVGDLATITGQKPIVTRATKSIAQFRLRTGMPVGAKVTLRGQRMYDFVERTLRLALPRIRDFRGVSPGSFDGRGNFSLGLREQLMYPEIDYDKIDRLRGLEISFVTTARNDEEGRRLLALLGMPFAAN